MAMAGRCIQRLIASASASSLLRALPASSISASNSAQIHLFSALNLAPDAPASFRAGTTGSSHLEPEPYHGDGALLAGHGSWHEFHTSLRVSSISVSDGGLRTPRSNEPLSSTGKGLGLQMLLDGTDTGARCFATKASSPPSSGTVVGGKDKDQEEHHKTLEDFQHEEIVGPTVERDLSPVADELRESLENLQKRILSFQKSLIFLGLVQGTGAVWSYVTWRSLDPAWQLVPSALLSFTLALALRKALQPMTFFGKLEERSRLRIVTLSLMVAKGFATFFNRARILVAASVVGMVAGLLYAPVTYLLNFWGFK